MTDDLDDSPLSTYVATLQHIELISRKIAKLVSAQVEAERQVLHRAGRDYTAGRLSTDDLLALYHRYRDTVCPEGDDGKRAYVGTRPGYSNLWNEAIPLHHGQVANYAKSERFLRRYQPNGTDGTWWGETPLTMDAPRPRNGQAVVYVLFDHENVPCYVGSTHGFKGRIDAHGREKVFARWVAYPCADREAAFQMEERLLREHKPYLNRKVGR